LPYSIFLRLILVDWPINFNYQFYFFTVEIYDKLSYAVLASKTKPMYLVSAKQLPKQVFSLRRFSPFFTGYIFELFP